MSADWIEIPVEQPTQLPQLLEQNGVESDEQLLRNVWMSPRNRPLHQPTARPPYTLRPGDTVWIPPPPMPAGTSLSTYTTTGSEGSVEDIAEAIRGRHGPGAQDQLTVSSDELTGDYLLGLVYNTAFRVRHRGSSPAPIEAGEIVRYPTRRRGVRPHSVSPATSMQPGAQTTVPTGDGAFDVTVELDDQAKILKFFDETARRWRAQPVRFKVRFTPKEGDVTPVRVTLRVLKEDRSVYFTEERADGAWLQNGEHTWDWDGFTTPAPVGGEADRGQLDTQVLRGRLVVEVLVEPPRGLPGRGELHLANQAHLAPYVDVRVDLASREIQGIGWVEFHHVSEDAGLWLTALLLLALIAAAVVLVEMLVMGIHAGAKGGEGGELSGSEIDEYLLAMLGSAALVIGLGTVIAGITAAALRLSDTEFATLSGNLRDGIGRHWSRQVSIGGQNYRFNAAGRTQAGHPGVTFALMKPLFPGQRAVNLSMVVDFAPIIIPYSDDAQGHYYEGAHEFGHSILAAAVDKAYSVRHKGTSGDELNQDPVPVSQGGERLPAFGDVDLMKYYTDGQITGDRLKADELDALRFVSIAQVEFRPV